jgi:hypothetical protein
MKLITNAGAVAILVAAMSPASAQYYGTGSNAEDHYVSGYTRNNGTYVSPHYQTNPNNSTSDNYETRGNLNPHTGQWGTRSPY